MIPDLTRTELAARLRSSIEGKEAWDYVATNVGLVASAVKFLAPSAGIADAMIAESRRLMCDCRRCLNESDGMINGWPASLTMMILCPTCGNKRCPHANDHRNSCTSSNESGQAGSAYPVVAASELAAKFAIDPSDGPSDDKILDALVEALDVDRAGAMKLILRVAGVHLDVRAAAEIGRAVQ